MEEFVALGQGLTRLNIRARAALRLVGLLGLLTEGQYLLDQRVCEFGGFFGEGKVAGVFESDEVLGGGVDSVEEGFGYGGGGVGVVTAFEEEDRDMVVVAEAGEIELG